MTDDLVQFLHARLDDDVRVARAASGHTVIEVSGLWANSPSGDEWEAEEEEGGAQELLVALRPGLPRPPDVMSGLWGGVVSSDPALSQEGEIDVMPQLLHAARHDPARILAEVDAKRRLVEEMASVVAGEWVDAGEPVLAQRVLSVVALPYASHPDYRKEWAPDPV